MRQLVATVMLLAVMLCGCALGQATEMKALLSGEEYPLALQMKDLDAQWRRLSVGGAAESGGMAQMYAAMLGGSGGVYYTKGETVSAGTETYLIAYARRTKLVDYMAVLQRGQEPGPPEELTADSLLSLSLLNLRTVGSLVDIRPFSLPEELATHQQIFERTVSQNSLSNLKNLALAVQMFLADNDDVMPDMTDTEAVLAELEDYVKNHDVFLHPDTGQPYGVNSALSKKRLVEFEDISSIAVFYEAAAAVDGTRGVGFLDGHAARVNRAQWEEIKEISGIE